MCARLGQHLDNHKVGGQLFLSYNKYHILLCLMLNWTSFWFVMSDLCRCSEAFLQGNLEDSLKLETFIDKLCEFANRTITKSNPNPKKPQKPWVSDEYKLVILNRKRSFEY